MHQSKTQGMLVTLSLRHTTASIITMPKTFLFPLIRRDILHPTYYFNNQPKLAYQPNCLYNC